MPLIWVSLSFIAGTVISSIYEIESWLCFLLSGSLIVIFFFQNLYSKKNNKKTSKNLQIAFLFLIFSTLGAARYSSTRIEIDIDHAAWYNDNGERMYVEGVVYKFPDERDQYTNLYIEVEKIGRTRYGIRPVEGKILLLVPRNTELKYGDKVFFTGNLVTPNDYEDFSYKNYLARKQIYSLVYYPYVISSEIGYGNQVISWLGEIREKGISLINQYLPDPEASLLNGIVLGYERGIEEGVQRAFRDTGTAHVIAISGANISVIAGVMMIMFARWFGPRRGAVFAFIGVILYTILVGADAVVVRAAIMGSISLFVTQIGRKQHGLSSLLMTAGIMVMVNPDVLWDIGFQLSFSATFGLVILSEPITSWVMLKIRRFISLERFEKISGLVSEYLVMTVAAQITTLPIILYHFGRLSITSLPANFFILPAQPPIMLLGGLSVLAGLIWKPIGQIISYFVWPFLAFTIRVVEWFSVRFRNTVIINDFNIYFVILFFVFILIVFYWKKHLAKLFQHFKLGWVVIILLILNLFVWNAIFYSPDDNLHVNILDVGSGSGILIQTPEGRYVLINGGASSSKISAGVGRNLPLFQQRIDALIIISCEKEEIDGLSYAVESFLPNQVFWGCDRSGNRSSRYLDETLSELGVEDINLITGDEIDLGGGAKFDFIQVSEKGADLLLKMNVFKMLIIGDSNETSGVASASILFAGQGEADVITERLLAKISPNLVVLSVGAGDGSGRPEDELLDLLDDIQILRTDDNGWIRISTDGDEYWLVSEK